LESAGRVAACEPPRRLLVTNRETDESYTEGQGVPPFDETIEATLTARYLAGREPVEGDARAGELVQPYLDLAAAAGLI
jgi:hypothetical protein